VSDITDSIRKLAMLAVIEPDASAFLRRISRWFSQTFHTPLNEVEDLPTGYILQHYYEHTFEQMESKDRHNLIIELLESPSERADRKRKQESEDDQFLAQMEKELEEEKNQTDVLKEVRKLAKKLNKNTKLNRSSEEIEEPEGVLDDDLGFKDFSFNDDSESQS